ncbi:MAG: 3-dehydroquinate synthase [Chlamydiota bacterium]
MQVNFISEPLQTKICFSPSFLEADLFWDAIESLTSPAFLLTEKTAGALFAPLIEKILQEKGIFVTVLTIPSGEEIKSFPYQEKIINFMIEQGLGQDTCLIALGGGALLDVAGFIASIYARGIPLLSIPTTLLSMVDACLGGKTGINALNGKNAVGTFYPASHILIASECLNTLPERQLQSALAEIIKYSLILDKQLFSLLQAGKDLWEKKDPIFIEKLIRLSLLAKKSVIEKDLKEQGLRRILNFGHTIAHAIESLSNYEVLHGEAVAIGLLIESRLSFQLNLLSKQDMENIVDLLRNYGFTKKILSFSYEELEPFLQKDKKNRGKNIRFVLLSSIGKASDCNGDYCMSVPKEDLLVSMAWYKALVK